MDMDIEKDARPPAKQASRPRRAMELDAIASLVGEGGCPRSAGKAKASPATGLFRVLYGPVVGFVFTCGIIFSLWLTITDKDPIYTVAIAAVSGLDPATDIGRRPTLDPEFNLTVGIVPRRALQRQCDELSTTAKVAYHGYELASAAAPQLCVLGGERMSTTVVARGARVWLPGPVLDSLAADVRRAAGVFDVTLAIRTGRRAGHGGDGLLVSCMGRRVGDATGGDLCDVAELHPERAH